MVSALLHNQGQKVEEDRMNGLVLSPTTGRDNVMYVWRSSDSALPAVNATVGSYIPNLLLDWHSIHVSFRNDHQHAE